MGVSDLRWLKKLLAESMLENKVTREALQKKVVTVPAGAVSAAAGPKSEREYARQ